MNFWHDVYVSIPVWRGHPYNLLGEQSTISNLLLQFLCLGEGV